MKILIIRFSALGDLVLLSGPLQQLKQRLPGSEVHLLTSEIGAELYSANPNLDKVIIHQKTQGLLKLMFILRKMGPYDHIFDLQGKLKSQLIRFFVKGRFHTLEKNNRARRRFVRKRIWHESLKRHLSEKYFSSFASAFAWIHLDLPSLRPQLTATSLVWEGSKFSISDAVVIHPYASHKNKVWPHTQRLIDLLNEQKRPVLVVGQSSDSTEKFRISVGEDLTNRTSVREMMSLIKEAQAVVSTDSGPLHLAVALNRPTLALFGPTTRELGFAPEFPGVKILERTDLDCRPCHIHGGDICPLAHHKCMIDITPETVISELNHLLETKDQ